MRYAPLGLAFMLASCAPITWDRPGTTQAEFNQDNARCRLVAQGMNPGGFIAVGSASYVAGAAVGNAIGTAVSQYATHRDCMMATGYMPSNPNADLTGTPATDDEIRASCERSRVATPALIRDAAWVAQCIVERTEIVRKP